MNLGELIVVRLSKFSHNRAYAADVAYLVYSKEISAWIQNRSDRTVSDGWTSSAFAMYSNSLKEILSYCRQ